jgi:hypothetical protein
MNFKLSYRKPLSYLKEKNDLKAGSYQLGKARRILEKILSTVE